MLSFIKRRLTYANVAVTAALVFAMAGGAFAASRQAGPIASGAGSKGKAKYVITSKSQISPAVLNALKGAAGATGSEGKPGAAGKEGLAGKNGVNGNEGKQGNEGKEGKEGKQGIPGEEGEPGKEGSPWTVNSTLPVGSAKVGKKGKPGPQETGVWTYVPAAVDTNEDVPISFPIKLATALPAENATSHEKSVQFIEPDKAEGQLFEAAAITQGHCGGTAEHPEAAAGYLCIFIGYEVGEISYEGVYSPLTAGRQSAERGVTATTGAVLVLEAEELKREEVGTWAVGGD
ncbi:MAG TPA: hypothetical protein VGP17_05330 [Solirubrobacteraceae bacterium]|jgi:hypothetical protein|nr:hypothetical protein [Solirubrobacteraceae bacterium]